MKEFKGTNTDQGWNLHRDEDGDLCVIAGHEDFFGGYTPVFKCGQSGELGEADANLAASAPEMLDVIEELLKAIDNVAYRGASFNGKEMVEAENKAKAVIRKALGE